MEFTLDLHTHTVASGHAYSTVQEMAKAAADKGLKLLGITEHAQGIPGTCDEIYFHNMRIIPRKMYGIDLMFGSEINIIDHDGTLSMEEKIIEILVNEIAVPIIVDAGIGRPSQACEAMEMGVAAVMCNTAVATAKNIPLMARAFGQAIESGRNAYLAGLGRVLTQAEASSPLTGFLED